jgi:hypothetical protein
MPTRDARPDIDCGGPATHRIVVQGTLGMDRSDRLAGLAISTTIHPGEAPRTTLEGRIRAQAQLNGVLETLYGLHLPMLEVKQLSERSES